MRSSNRGSNKTIFWDFTFEIPLPDEKIKPMDLFSESIPENILEANSLYLEDIESLNTWQIKDVNDSMAWNKLIEHETYNDYALYTDFKNRFNYYQYCTDFVETEIIHNKFIVKVPSFSLLKKGNSFSISVRQIKSSLKTTDNYLIKFISDNFTFSESMFQLLETDKSLFLTKKPTFKNYNVKIKIYCNNVVVYEAVIDLSGRQAWA